MEQKYALTAGVEPATSPLGGEHSIQLSYASKHQIIAILLNKASRTLDYSLFRSGLTDSGYTFLELLTEAYRAVMTIKMRLYSFIFEFF